MNKLLSSLILFLVLASGSAVQAESDLERRLGAKLKLLLPDAKITSISESPIPGLYEVVVGTSLTYMSEDGRYAFSGDMIDIDEMKNLSDARRKGARAARFTGLGSRDYIEFRPKGKIKRALYVFTDIDCGYCRKLHQEVPALNEAGVAVRYLAFPRSGVGSESFDKLVSVWCSKDRSSAMTSAKAGAQVTAVVCDNPVTQHYRLGEDFGIRGTPAVYLENGEQIGGFRTAKEVIAEYVNAKS